MFLINLSIDCSHHGNQLTLFYHSAILRNEVGWFDEEENSVDTLSMRLANDATFVRAAFSNRLSVFIQDSASVVAAVIVGMLLEWRLAFVALGTLPILIVSAVAQVCIHAYMLFNGEYNSLLLLFDVHIFGLFIHSKSFSLTTHTPDSCPFSTC